MTCERCEGTGTFLSNPNSDDLTYCSCRHGRWLRLLDHMALVGLFGTTLLVGGLLCWWLRSK